MIYGKAKARQMARGILPSTAREYARNERAATHRAARRATRVAMHLTRFSNDFDEEDGEGASGVPDVAVRRDIRYMVNERRQADKVRPIMLWADAVTRNLIEPDEKTARMRSLLPKNMIGQHALEHIQRLDGFKTDPHRFRGRSWAMPTPDWTRPWPSMAWTMVCALVENPSNIGALNSAMRRRMRTMYAKQFTSFPIEGEIYDRDFDLRGSSDVEMERWWKALKGMRYDAFSSIVADIAREGFHDCRVEGIFFVVQGIPEFEG